MTDWRMLEPGETLSEGTLRLEDIGTAYAEALAFACPDVGADKMSVQSLINDWHDAAGAMERSETEDAIERASEVCEEMRGMLQDYACPEDHYIGAHYGDGALFGVWRVEE